MKVIGYNCYIILSNLNKHHSRNVKVNLLYITCSVRYYPLAECSVVTSVSNSTAIYGHIDILAQVSNKRINFYFAEAWKTGLKFSDFLSDFTNEGGTLEGDGCRADEMLS